MATAGTGVSMTSRQRAARDLEIFEARQRGTTWDEIAAAADVTARHARRIYASFESDEAPLERDPVVVVEELYWRYESAYERLGEIAEEATNDSAKLGAIKAQLDVANSEVALLQAVSALPRDLGHVGEQLDAQRVLKTMDMVFTKHAVPAEAWQELAKVLSAPRT